MEAAAKAAAAHVGQPAQATISESKVANPTAWTNTAQHRNVSVVLVVYVAILAEQMPSHIFLILIVSQDTNTANQNNVAPPMNNNLGILRPSGGYGTQQHGWGMMLPGQDNPMQPTYGPNQAQMGVMGGAHGNGWCLANITGNVTINAGTVNIGTMTAPGPSMSVAANSGAANLHDNNGMSRLFNK